MSACYSGDKSDLPLSFFQEKAYSVKSRRFVIDSNGENICTLSALAAESNVIALVQLVEFFTVYLSSEKHCRIDCAVKEHIKQTHLGIKIAVACTEENIIKRICCVLHTIDDVAVNSMLS